MPINVQTIARFEKVSRAYVHHLLAEYDLRPPATGQWQLNHWLAARVCRGLHVQYGIARQDLLPLARAIGRCSAEEMELLVAGGRCWVMVVCGPEGGQAAPELFLRENVVAAATQRAAELSLAGAAVVGLSIAQEWQRLVGLANAGAALPEEETTDAPAE
jgi:hypothetical protein